jgi:sulfur-carrier protein
VIATVHVELPSSLCLIAGTGRKLTLSLATPVTQRRILDALELRYPMLRGTIRDRNSKARRPFIRFFACRNDLSHHSPDDPLPQAIADGTETFYVIAAIAGG